MGKKLREEDLVLNIIVNGDRGKKEMGELERSIKDTSKELNALNRREKQMRMAGKENTREYKAVTEAIKQKNDAIAMAESRLKLLKSQMDVNKMSARDLRSEMSRLKQLRDIATPLSVEWQKHDARLKQVQARYAQLNTQANTTGASLKNLAGRFNHYVGVITAGFATMFAAVTGIRQSINDFAEFDDKIADVQKTTNLTRETVIGLNEDFKNIDTRTAQNDLLGLARVAGKLAIEGEENILGFVKAADMIGVALSEDLGGDVEASITAVGKLVDIFKVTEDYPLEESLLKVGSTINELGMASTANEGYIVEFTRRMAGVGPLADISVTKLMGMGATLDSLGQTSEVSTTALSKLFLAMAKNYEVYAKYANMPADAFKELVDSDANEAFIKVLEGVKNNSGGLTELAGTLGDLGQDGGRVIGVLGSLANNTQKLREQQEIANRAFEEGTSLSVEFATKNETAQAKLDKARKGLKNMSIELGDRLMPIMAHSISGFNMFIRLLTTLFDFFSKHGKAIAVLTAAVVAYNLALWISNINLKENIILTKGKIFWENASLAATQLLAAAQMLLAGNIKGAAQAMRVFNSVAKLNPWVLLASVIIAAGTALYFYSRQLTSIEKAQRAVADVQNEALRNTVDERLEVERLLAFARDVKNSYEDRADAIKKLNEISPEYLGNLDMENIHTKEATDATGKYIEALLRKAKMEAAYNKVAEIERKRLDLIMDGKGAELSWTQSVANGFKRVAGMHVRANADVYKYRKENTENLNEELDAQRAALEKFIKDNQLIQQGLKPNGGTDPTNPNPDPIIPTGGGDGKKAEDERNRELERIAAYRQKVLEEQLSLIEQERLAHKRRLEEADLFGKDRSKMTEDELAVLLALEKKHYENLDKLDADAVAQDINRRQNAFDDELRELRIKNNEEYKSIKTIEQAKAALQGELSDEALLGIRNMRQAQQELDKMYRREEESLVKDHLNNLRAEIEATLQHGNWEGVDLSDEILSEEERAVLEARLNSIREELSKLGLGSGSEIAEDRGMRSSNIDILGMRPEDWQTLFDNLENGRIGVEEIVFLSQALGNIWSDYNKFVAAGEQRKMQQFETNSRNQQDLLKRQLDAGIINQEQYAQQVDKINADVDRKKAVYERNQAKRERNVALMSAIVNTAAAVAKSLPNLILAGIVGVAGGLQIGTILRTPLPDVPGAEDGGFLNVRRSQDNKRFRAKKESRTGFFDRPSVLVSEAGAEFVANNDAVNNPTVKPVLDAIDTAQRNGYINSLDLFKVLEQNRTLRGSIPGRQKGGFMDASNAAPRSGGDSGGGNSEMKTFLDENMKILKKISQQLETPIEANVVLTGRKGFNEKQKELSDIEKSANL